METMNFFAQQKLSRAEWNGIEVPVDPSEIAVLQMISDNYTNVNAKLNRALTLMTFTKIAYSPAMEKHLYVGFFAPIIDAMLDKVARIVFPPTDGAAAAAAAANGIAAAVEELIKCRSTTLMQRQTTTTTFASKVSAAAAGAPNKMKISSADAIRLQQLTAKIAESNADIFEFVLLSWCESMHELIVEMFAATTTTKKKAKGDHHHTSSAGAGAGAGAKRLAVLRFLYTIVRVQETATIVHKNSFVNHFVAASVSFATAILGGTCAAIRMIVENAHYIVETNQDLWKFADKHLFQHQKDLFLVFAQKAVVAATAAAAAGGGTLVLYSAPTGTGKTLSPLGLSRQYKVIFVCVARHVGLALARAAISIGRRVAFAFGCESANDIRLHYFAAKEYTKHKRSGGIGKVDNSNGSKVEIMICDVQSYVCAMLYMCAFHEPENIIFFWDEPTITLDLPTHPIHPLLTRLWRENKIPNIILSSATLPREEDIPEIIADFRARFGGETARVYSISSFESRKSVSLVDKQGCFVAPHTLYGDFGTMRESAQYIEKNQILIKYMDVSEVSRFLSFMHARNNDNACVDENIAAFFQGGLSDVSLHRIKMYYIEVLCNITDPEEWTNIFISLAALSSATIKNNGFLSGVLFTTQDAHTLTDGPSIYLTEDVDKVSTFYLQQAQIPASVLQVLERAIDGNTRIQMRIDKLRRDIDDMCARDADKDRKQASAAVAAADGASSTAAGCRNPAERALRTEVDALTSRLVRVALDDVYVPNTRAHQARYDDGRRDFRPACFTRNIDDATVEKIVSLAGVDTAHKLLLLMGIAVFGNTGESGSNGNGADAGGNRDMVEYLETMKQLAHDQKLFLVIASADYVYGTNYNFCHGVIGKNMNRMTRQKTIQAIGRVGRGDAQKTYTVRFREDTLLYALFLPTLHMDEDAETTNMNRLFVF